MNSSCFVFVLENLVLLYRDNPKMQARFESNVLRFLPLVLALDNMSSQDSNFACASSFIGQITINQVKQCTQKKTQNKRTSLCFSPHHITELHNPKLCHQLLFLPQNSWADDEKKNLYLFCFC